MTGKILALGMAVALLAAGSVWADQPGTMEEEIEVIIAPTPAPAPRAKPTTGTIELDGDPAYVSADERVVEVYLGR